MKTKIQHPDDIIKSALKGCILEECSGDERISEALDSIAMSLFHTQGALYEYERKEEKASKRVYSVLTVGYNKTGENLVNEFHLIRGDALEEFMSFEKNGNVMATYIKWGCQQFFTVWDDGTNPNNGNVNGELNIFEAENDGIKYLAEKHNDIQILIWLKLRNNTGYYAFAYDDWMKMGRCSASAMHKVLIPIKELL